MENPFRGPAVDPRTRPTWNGMQRGRRHYALRAYNLALRNRGLPTINIDAAALADVPVNRPATPPLPDNFEDLDIDDLPSNIDSPPAQSSQGSEAGDVMTGEPAAKRIRVDGQIPSTSAEGPLGSAREGATGTNPGAPAGLAGDGGQNIQPVPRPQFRRNEHTLVFEKVHRLVSYGFANTIVPTTAATDPYVYMSTSMAEIPWDRPFFYLTPGEYLMLPDGCHVKHVSIKIIQRNPRVAFEVNATTSGLATLNQNKFGSYALGLNKSIYGVNRRYQTEDGAPMVPTTFAAAEVGGSYTGLDTALYGVANTVAAFRTAGAAGSVPAAIFGTVCALPYYYNAVSQAANTTAPLPTADVGWQHFQAHCQDYDAGTMVGQTILESEYTPHIAPLTAPLETIFRNNNTVAPSTVRTSNLNNTRCGMQTDHTGLPVDADPAAIANVQQYVGNATGVAVGTVFTVADSMPTPTGLTLTNAGNRLKRMEKSQQIMFDTGEHQHQQAQPSVHVGIRAVPALTASADGTVIQPTVFTDVQMYYEVHAKMTVGYGYPQYFSRSARRNIGPKGRMFKALNVAGFTNTLDDDSFVMYEGLYQVNR
jgi:hypothetical protein